MSTLLPIVEPRPDFIGELLRDQQSLSAVERFSLFENRVGIHLGAAVSGPEALTPGLPRTADAAAYRPAQSRYYRDLLPASPPGPGQQYAFEVDLDKCSGCKACVVACHTLNGLEEEEAWRRVGTVSAGVNEASVQHITTACHHCEDPGCLRGCPVKAYEKDATTGIVRHLDDQCIGCKYCTMMCPYEVPRYSERLGIVRKCDLCQQRLATGEAPACVQACPNEAIAIAVVDIQGGHGQASEENARLAPGAPPSRLTRPTTRYRTAHATAFATAEAQDAMADPVAESHWPLAVMLVATQWSVGIVLAERVTAMLMAVAGREWPAEATALAATLALMVGAVGLAIAPLHLGQPLRAWRVFLGLCTSWLSREAVLLGLYMGMLGLVVTLLGCRWLGEAVPTVMKAVPDAAAGVALALTLLIGLLGLYSSAMIYIVTSRRLWRRTRTLPRFLGTAAIGGLWSMVPVSVVSSDGVLITQWIAAATAIALLVKLAWEYRVHRGVSAAEQDDRRSAKLAWGPLRRVSTARYVLGLSAVVAACLVIAVAPISPVIMVTAAVGAAIVLTGGELCERLLYFSSVVHDRMPGTLR